MEEPVLIVGSGAVATLFAAQLAASGAAVQMLANWQGAVDAISRHGARLLLPDGREVAGRVEISTDPAAFYGAKNVLVLVKSWQTQRAAEQLQGILAADGVALTLQNGLGNREILADVLGVGRVSAGVIILGAQTEEPGVTRTTGPAWVHLEDDQRLDDLIDRLKNAGFRIDLHKDIRLLQWEKLVTNAAINPLSAVLGVPNGKLLENPHAHQLLKALVQEACFVAEAAGVRLPENLPEKIEGVIQRTGGNRSSMLQDLLRGAPTEIDAINGSLLQVAQEVSVDAPLNGCFVTLVKALSGSQRDQNPFLIGDHL